jgi:ABC-type sugar transport system ATPase subunit
MIYQEISVHLDLSVAENIFLGRIPTKHGVVQWAKMFENAQKYADMVGLKVPISTHLRDLSASQCQMVSIARALSRNPKILVLDEPTSPLTDAEVEELFKILFQLREKGFLHLYQPQNPRNQETCDRVSFCATVAMSGETAADLSVEEIVEGMVNARSANMYPKEGRGDCEKRSRSRTSASRASIQ